MIHIFRGSIHKRYYSVIEDYYSENRPYLRESSTPVEWRTIQTNNKINFPLKSGDYVNVNNESLYIFSTTIHDNGSIVCLTNKIIDILSNEENKKHCEDKIKDLNDKYEKEKNKKKSWLKRVFG